jgi:nucleoid-associated protein YgaU
MMNLINFVMSAGEKLGLVKAEKEESQDVANLRKAEALSQHVQRLKLTIDDLQVDFNDGLATVHGKAATQSEREKVILAIGNTEGVAQVDDRIEVAAAEQQATYHTVESGDTLSKIAKAHYGNPMKYPVIFEANKPMLTDPDKIYPGQVLRIPPIQ